MGARQEGDTVHGDTVQGATVPGDTGQGSLSRCDLGKKPAHLARIQLPAGENTMDTAGKAYFFFLFSCLFLIFFLFSFSLFFPPWMVFASWELTEGLGSHSLDFSPFQ